MKKTRYTEEQTVFALKQAETCTRVKELYRKMAISGGHFLQLEEKVWRDGGDRIAPSTTAGG